MKIQDIYNFYTKENIEKLKKSEEGKKENKKNSLEEIIEEIKKDRSFFEEQLNSFIKKYMR